MAEKAIYLAAGKGTTSYHAHTVGRKRLQDTTEVDHGRIRKRRASCACSCPPGGVVRVPPGSNLAAARVLGCIRGGVRVTESTHPGEPSGTGRRHAIALESADPLFRLKFPTPLLARPSTRNACRRYRPGMPQTHRATRTVRDVLRTLCGMSRRSRSQDPAEQLAHQIESRSTGSGQMSATRIRFRLISRTTPACG
jgi:hypothetical protein